MVKGFNTLSAWALQNGPSDASRQVASQCLDFVFNVDLSCHVGVPPPFAGIITLWNLPIHASLLDSPCTH